MTISHLATLTEVQALLAGAQHLPDDAQVRSAYAQAAARVFRTCEQLVEYASAVAGRSQN